jgi:hypothetical protein
MNTLFIILSVLGININIPKKTNFTWNEKRFIKNVIKIQGQEPLEVYKLKNNKIQINYPNQRLTLGQDGFIHDLEILDNGKWVDLGPEY